MTIARRAFSLAMAMVLASRSVGQEPASTSPVEKGAVPAAVAAPTTVAATASSETSPAGPAVSTDAAESSEAYIPNGVAEFGEAVGLPSRSCFGEALVGYYRSTSIGPVIPGFDYVPIAFRLGYRPWEDRGYIASRISVIAEATVDPIVSSYGNCMTGASVLARYDVCPDRTVCPYFQAGTGFVLTDAWHDESQRAIGEEFEFLQQLEVGVRWQLNECLAVEAEFGLQHISNGGLARRNAGANDLGGSIGVRWTFGGR